jgi:hypothetical protein
VEGAQQYALASVQDTADSGRPDYWVRRRSAASVEAFWFSVLCMLVLKGRGWCAVFMGAAGRAT